MSLSPHCRSIGDATLALILAFTPALLPAQQEPSPPVAKIVERVDTVGGWSGGTHTPGFGTTSVRARMS